MAGVKLRGELAQSSPRPASLLLVCPEAGGTEEGRGPGWERVPTPPRPSPAPPAPGPAFFQVGQIDWPTRVLRTPGFCLKGRGSWAALPATAAARSSPEGGRWEAGQGPRGNLLLSSTSSRPPRAPTPAGGWRAGARQRGGRAGAEQGGARLGAGLGGRGGGARRRGAGAARGLGRPCPRARGGAADRWDGWGGISIPERS